MGYYDAYDARLSVTSSSPNTYFSNHMSKVVNDAFANWVNFRSDVLVNGAATDVRVLDVKLQVRNEAAEGMMFDSKILHFRPGIIQNLGSLVQFDGWNYLIIDYNANPIYPKARLLKCNNTLAIQSATSNMVQGTDPMGRPIYSTTPTTPTTPTSKSYPCITKDIISIPNLNQTVNIPAGQIQARIKYDSTITEGQNFTMNNKNYRIIGLDDNQVINGAGILNIIAERVT